MIQLGKILIGGGVILLLLGVLIWTFGRAGFRGLPGDIRYEGERTSFYFPIVTCLAISVLVTLAKWLWDLWNR